jgi:TetR/AcrR family acrAB operon transcriptional repressor
LFNAMCERVRLPMEELVAAGLNADNDDPLGHLREVCVFFLKEAATNVHLRKVSDILFHKCEFVDPADPVYIRQKEAFLRGREHLTKLLEQAVDKGQLAPDLDIRAAAVMFHAGIEGVLKQWLFSAGSFDLAQEAERLVEAYLDLVRYASGLRVGGKPS